MGFGTSFSSRGVRRQNPHSPKSNAFSSSLDREFLTVWSKAEGAAYSDKIRSEIVSESFKTGKTRKIQAFV